MTTKRGFTLIELLVVIAIIALLSSVVLASLASARMKTRDTKRVADMRNILMALQIYQDRYGCIPTTSSSNNCGVAKGLNTADPGLGGWDYSSSGSFMAFLATGTEPIMETLPIDPINNMTGDNAPIGTYAYAYFCYPGEGLALAYWKESTPWARIWYTKYRDPEFTCK